MKSNRASKYNRELDQQNRTSEVVHNSYNVVLGCFYFLVQQESLHVEEALATLEALVLRCRPLCSSPGSIFRGG